MDTEMYVGQEVLVKLTINEITEKSDGVYYLLKHPENSIMSVFVPSDAIVEVCNE